MVHLQKYDKKIVYNIVDLEKRAIPPYYFENLFPKFVWIRQFPIVTQSGKTWRTKIMKQFKQFWQNLKYLRKCNSTNFSLYNILIQKIKIFSNLLLLALLLTSPYFHYFDRPALARAPSLLRALHRSCTGHLALVPCRVAVACTALGRVACARHGSSGIALPAALPVWDATLDE